MVNATAYIENRQIEICMLEKGHWSLNLLTTHIITALLHEFFHILDLCVWKRYVTPYEIYKNTPHDDNPEEIRAIQFVKKVIPQFEKINHDVILELKKELQDKYII